MPDIDFSSLVFEAVKNSAEANAKCVKVKVKKDKGKLKALIEDDGEGEIKEKDFLLSCSSKGEARGRGLFLIREKDQSSKAERINGKTKLFFETKDDGSLDKVDCFVFPLFSLGVRVDVFIEEGEEKIAFLYEEFVKKGLICSDGVKAKLKTLIREIGVEKWQNSH